MNARCIGCSSSPSASPSIVVISWPSQAIASVRQASTRRPSTQTVQAPHVPWSQPFLVPVRSRCSRSASSRLTRGSSSTTCCPPLTSSGTGTLAGLRDGRDRVRRSALRGFSPHRSTADVALRLPAPLRTRESRVECRGPWRAAVKPGKDSDRKSECGRRCRCGLSRCGQPLAGECPRRLVEFSNAGSRGAPSCRCGAGRRPECAFRPRS